MHYDNGAIEVFRYTLNITLHYAKLFNGMNFVYSFVSRTTRFIVNIARGCDA